MKYASITLLIDNNSTPYTTLLANIEWELQTRSFIIKFTVDKPNTELNVTLASRVTLIYKEIDNSKIAFNKSRNGLAGIALIRFTG